MRESKSTFLLSLACVVCWGIWGFLAKVGAAKLTPEEEQVLFTAGMAPLVAVAFWRLRGRLETRISGAVCGLLNGLLATAGMVVFYVAMGSGPASMVTAVTALFPLVTVVLAVTVLRERLNKIQFAGALLAVCALALLTT